MKEMPKLGMITNPSEEIVSEINKASRLGFDFIEIAIEPPKAAPNEIAKKKASIIKAVKRFSSPPIIHTAYWCHLGDSYEGIRNAWITEMKREIRLASSLGTSGFNIHFNAKGMLHKEYLKTVSDNYIASLRELVSFAKNYEIKVIFENTPHTYSNFNNYRYVVDRVPGLCAHLDLGHIFITDGMKGFSEFFSHFDERIEHIHIHDNYGLADDHLPLGKGKINFRTVVKELKKIKYNRTITFEVHEDKGLMDSVRLFKRLWS